MSKTSKKKIQKFTIIHHEWKSILEKGDFDYAQYYFMGVWEALSGKDQLRLLEFMASKKDDLVVIWRHYPIWL